MTDLTETRPMCKGIAMRELFEAVEMFNAGDWYESHEILDMLWLAETSPERELYQGVLQIAAGLWHDRRGNRNAAQRLCTKGLGHLRSFPETCKGLRLGNFIRQVETLLHFFEQSATAPVPDDLIPFIYRTSDPQ
ncbi:DUF309 domain-containing protein [Oleidesulfovibrio alaskensis]|nr:DUF309 domain-containing protein [Oleidesulfovibrio alaskensis]MBG0774329.1 DUF309 domain-containing protein [Oleidesulfovibrio alaskensis]MBL3583508.1 DUF309 domain-containing protein [Oleidesulfovibrio alaskensis]